MGGLGVQSVKFTCASQADEGSICITLALHVFVNMKSLTGRLVVVPGVGQRAGSQAKHHQQYCARHCNVWVLVSSSRGDQQT